MKIKILEIVVGTYKPNTHTHYLNGPSESECMLAKYGGDD